MSEPGTHAHRVEKFLKNGREEPRLANYADVWQTLDFVEERNDEFGDFFAATSHPDASYFLTFFNDLFEITDREGRDSALVSTHSHWLEDFADHVLKG